MNETSISQEAARELAGRLLRQSVVRRWLYRWLLCSGTAVLAMVTSLWLTEPKPLPLALHLAFSAMTLISLGWTSIATYHLWFRQCHSINDRVLTAWWATFSCLLFLLIGAPIAFWRGPPSGAIAVLATGATLLTFAAVTLWQSYRRKRWLAERLATLKMLKSAADDSHLEC